MQRARRNMSLPFSIDLKREECIYAVLYLCSTVRMQYSNTDHESNSAFSSHIVCTFLPLCRSILVGFPFELYHFSFPVCTSSDFARAYDDKILGQERSLGVLLLRMASDKIMLML
jgi:hypothetical protein